MFLSGDCKLVTVELPASSNEASGTDPDQMKATQIGRNSGAESNHVTADICGQWWATAS